MSGYRMWMRTCAAVLAVVCVTTGQAWAQAGTASLHGTIMDAQGAALPGVTVTATSLATAAVRTTVTDGSGSYQLLALPPGDYQVKFELSGFRTAVHDKVTLQVDLASKLDVPLEIGSSERDRERHRRSGPDQHDRRLDGQRHHRPAGPGAAARSQQRGRPPQPPAGRRLHSELRRDRRANRRRVEHRPAQRRRQRRPRRSVERHAGRYRRQRPPVRHRLQQLGARDPRFAAGVPRQHQQLRRRLGSIVRRAGLAGHPQRNERLPWQRPTGCSAIRVSRRTTTF